MDFDTTQVRMLAVVERLQAASSVRDPPPSSPEHAVEKTRTRKDPCPVKLVGSVPLGSPRTPYSPREYALEPIELGTDVERRKEAAHRQRAASLASLPFGEEVNLRENLEEMQQAVLKNPLLLGTDDVVTSEDSSGRVITLPVGTSDGGEGTETQGKSGMRKAKVNLEATGSSDVLFIPDPVANLKKADEPPTSRGLGTSAKRVTSSAPSILLPIAKKSVSGTVPASACKMSLAPVESQWRRPSAPAALSRAPTSDPEVESPDVEGVSSGKGKKLMTKKSEQRVSAPRSTGVSSSKNKPAPTDVRSPVERKKAQSSTGSAASLAATSRGFSSSESLEEEPSRDEAVMAVGHRICLDELPGCWQLRRSNTVINFVLGKSEPWVVAKMTRCLQKEMYPSGELGWIFSLTLHTVLTYKNLITCNQRLLSKAGRPCGGEVLYHRFVEAIGGATVDPFEAGGRLDQAPGAWSVSESHRIIQEVLGQPPPGNAARITMNLLNAIQTDLPRGHVFALVCHTIVALQALWQRSQRNVKPNRDAKDTYVIHNDLIAVIGDATTDAVISEPVTDSSDQ